MVKDELIEERALHIVAELTPDERKLYVLYYWQHKKLKDIANILNISYSNARKKHEFLKKKIIAKVKDYEQEE